MVVCLEAEVLPFVPFVLQAVLRDNDAFLLSEFMPLVLQVIMKFKVCFLFILDNMSVS